MSLGAGGQQWEFLWALVPVPPRTFGTGKKPHWMLGHHVPRLVPSRSLIMLSKQLLVASEGSDAGSIPCRVP